MVYDVKKIDFLILFECVIDEDNLSFMKVKK